MHDPSLSAVLANPGAPVLPAGVTIVANAADVDALRAALPASRQGEIACASLAADVELPEDLLALAKVLVIEVDPADTASIRRVGKVREARPDLPIIAALRDTNVTLVRTLVRQGIADVAQLPFRADELLAQIAEAAAGLAGKPGTAALAPMVTVAGSTGGCGATTVITHLAAELARSGNFPRGVCVVDLDMQSGEVAYYVGREPVVTVSSLLDAGERLDPEFLRGALTDSGHRFAIVAAPETITALDDIDGDQLLRLLSLIRREFDCVLVDLPADWTSWALSVVAASSEVLLVTELSVAGLRQAKRRLELFGSIGVADAAIRLVANRVERKLFRPIGLDEVEDVLGHAVAATLADEGEAMNSAQNEGQLITDIHRHSKFAADVHALCGVLGVTGR